MADPTLKDVLKAIAEIRGEMATKDDLARVEAKVDAVDAKLEVHRAETRKGFADLDEELTKHSNVHAEVEKEITALKRRTPAAPRATRPRRSR